MLIHRCILLVLVAALIASPVAQAIEKASTAQDMGMIAGDKQSATLDIEDYPENSGPCGHRSELNCTLHAHCLNFSCASAAAIPSDNRFLLQFTRIPPFSASAPIYSGYTPKIDPRPPRI